MRHAILADRAIDARLCRNEGIAQPYTYAFACMADYPEDKMARRLALRSRRGCADLVGLWPAWG
jgi:hypothetical protein